MIRSSGGQSIGAQMVSATTGAAFTSAVTVYITIDAGTQAIGSIGSGLCTHEGNGYHTYRPSAAETDGALIAFTFIGTGAIPVTLQIATVTENQQSTIGTASGSTSSTVNLSARTTINMALKILGVLASGETVTPEDEADAFTLLNGLMDSFGTQRMTPYTAARSTYAWTASASSQTIGAAGGDFTQQRPVSIEWAGFIPSGMTTEFEIPVYGQREYAALVDKTLTSIYPGELYVEPTHPLMILRLFPIPTVAGTLVLYYPEALTQFANATTVYTFPNGYARMLHYNLAKELIPIFNVPPSRIPLVMQIATDTLADVKRQNTDIPTLARPWHPYSIFTDSY